MSRSNKGFTLIELMVVLVIVGVLATISFHYYGGLFEKARADEAKQGLWEVRVAWGQYSMDRRNPPSGIADLQLSSNEFPVSCVSQRYFRYSLNSTHASAIRCTINGKPPQGPPYTVSLNLQNGTWSGTPGYY